MSSLSELKLYTTESHSCSYLVGQQAATLFIDPDTSIDNHQYSQLAKLGFRRSGNFVYRPHCANCSACIPTRIPVRSFIPNRTQRRTLKRGQSVEVNCLSLVNKPEHYKLYGKYINQRHADGDMYPTSYTQFKDFLLSDQFDTCLMEFKFEGRLVAVAVTDKLDDGLSAVYTYFDPEQTALSLGVLTILHQIEYARRENLDYLYLGYWIKDCAKMRYKLQYRPIEISIANRWTLLT